MQFDGTWLLQCARRMLFPVQCCDMSVICRMHVTSSDRTAYWTAHCESWGSWLQTHAQEVKRARPCAESSAQLGLQPGLCNSRAKAQTPRKQFRQDELLPQGSSSSPSLLSGIRKPSFYDSTSLVSHSRSGFLANHVKHGRLFTLSTGQRGKHAGTALRKYWEADCNPEF